MKKIILCLFFFAGLASSGFAQEYKYGLKAGLNFSQGGQITGDNSGVNRWDETLQGTGKVGIHGGAFFQVNFGSFLIRPELVYTSTGLDFEFPNRTSTYSVEKLDIPLLFGYNIWGPLDLYAGPVYSYILEGSLSGDQVEEPIINQDTPIHAQIGIKAEFDRFGIDLRYEHNRSGTELQNTLDTRRRFTRGGADGYGVSYVYFDDTRINQIILSITFKIGGSDMQQEKRMGSCFF